MTTLSTPHGQDQQPRRRAAKPAGPVEGDRVVADCGCVGEVNFAVLHGSYPYVSIVIRVPHTKRNPVHVPRVFAGVIERFEPQQLKPYAGPQL